MYVPYQLELWIPPVGYYPDPKQQHKPDYLTKGLLQMGKWQIPRLEAWKDPQCKVGGRRCFQRPLEKDSSPCHTFPWSRVKLGTIQTYFVFQDSLGSNDFVKNVFPHMSIHSRQGVVQQIDVSVAIDSSGKADPLLLATR